MTQQAQLPLYKATYDLMSAVVRATTKFPQAYKYNLGDKICNEAVELTVLSYKAGCVEHENKAHYAVQMLKHLQVLQLLVRLSKDLRILTVKQFSEIVGISDNLGRQVQA